MSQREPLPVQIRRKISFTPIMLSKKKVIQHQNQCSQLKEAKLHVKPNHHSEKLHHTVVHSATRKKYKAKFVLDNFLFQRLCSTNDVLLAT